MISSNDHRWMRLALIQAENAPHEKWRVGAVIVRGGSLLSKGFNKYRNDPNKVSIEGVSYHAEEVAIRKSGCPDGATIYIARLTKSGLWGMARPCDRCYSTLINEGINTIVYTTPDGVLKERMELAA